MSPASFDQPIAWVSSDFMRRQQPFSEQSGLESCSVARESWVPLEQLGVGIDDIGLRQSVVAVERLRTYQGHVVELQPHLIRYRRTLDFLNIAIVVDDQLIAQRIDQLILRNQTWCERAGDFGITLVATPGDSAVMAAEDGYGGPTEIIHLNALNLNQIAKRQLSGQPLVITDVRQPPAESWPRDIKVRCRLHYYLADLKAKQFAPDGLGVLIDADGSITETSVANLAIIKQGSIWSPPPQQVLPGVTQEVVRSVAMELGIPWHHQTLFPADLRQADEVILMGTDGGVWFANRVDGHPIHNNQPGPMFQRLVAGFTHRLLS